MKAMVAKRIAAVESSPLEYLEVPSPEPGPGEVRLTVSCCGVCRTDLHVVEGDLPQKKMPIIPGHEIVGTVEKLGAGCTRFQVGQRVGVAWLWHTCGTCAYCRKERENLCESSEYTGYTSDGGYAEYAVVPEAFAYEIPDVFNDVEAAPLLCAGIVGYRALKRAMIPDGGKLALYGFGSSAHVIFQIARHHGCRVFVVTRGEEHRQLARELGAEWVGENASDLPEKMDSAINFAPAGELVPAALKALDKGGTLALAGIHMSDVPQMNYQDCLFYERDIHAVTANTREDGRELFVEAAHARVQPRVVTYPLQEANRALQDLKADRIRGSAVLVVEV